MLLQIWALREGLVQITYSSSVIMSRMTDLIYSFTWLPEFMSSGLWFWGKQQKIMTTILLDIALGCFIAD